MEYDKVHGIERTDGVGVIFHGCRCGECDNVVMETTDSDDGSVFLTLSPGAFRRLLAEMKTLAKHVAVGNDPNPRLDGECCCEE